MDGMVAGTAAGTDDMLRVLGFAGSLRARSYNGALLRSAQELAPAGMAIEIYESIELPLFNEDIEAQGDPYPVATFKAAVRELSSLRSSTDGPV
jgi:chromate reductase